MSEDPHSEFERLVSELRPKLHRYCARMTGSAVDGEDIVQDTLMKALAALPEVGIVANPEGWLFRIAHNTALDFLRRRTRGAVIQSQDSMDWIATPQSPSDSHSGAASSLRTFMRLPALQRSAVILKDVLDHSLEEVSSITGASPAAAKSALQRGRARLRELAREPAGAPPAMLSGAMRARLVRYVEGFQLGDFDTVRAMLADDVKLDLVARLHRQGKSQVSEYYARYAACKQWAFAPGTVDRLPAMLVYDREVSLETPAYFVALDFDGDRVVRIRDFLFARYAMGDVEISLLHPGSPSG